MCNKITNKDFEDALSNINNKLMMEKACAPFRKFIDHDELYRCQLMALWACLEEWKHNGGAKFVSFLYRRVRWTCIKLINEKKKSKTINISIEKPIQNKVNIEEIVEKLPFDLQDIIIKRYIDGMTLREISNIHNCCHETIRRRIKKALRILRKNLY